MGTSASYSGPKGTNPLIPAWVDTPLAGEAAATESITTSPTSDPEGIETTPATLESPPPLTTSRLTPLRTAIRTSARAGGSDNGALRAAARHFVGKSMGGSVRGARRIGADRKSVV